MRSTVRSVLQDLRQPQYTGENRCLPCTVVNIAIAVVLAGAVSIASIRLAIAAFAVSLVAIYFRGYLVPGTPALTKRYLPERVLRLFDKRPELPVDDEDIDVERVLQDADAVTECEHQDDLCLTDSFRTAWRDRIETLQADDATREDLARVLDADADRLAFQDYGDAFVASADDARIGQWESRAAFIADVAAAAELRDRYPAWTRIDLEHRGRMLNGLRIFLERCPDCDGPVTVDQEVVESCCRSIDVVAVTCDQCGVRLFEAERPAG